MAFKLINKKPRSVLNEGRRQGLGAGFAKCKGDTLTMVGPISACKDYLSDQIYSEHTGKPYSACGYNAVKSNCFDTHAYQVISVLKYGTHNPQVYEGYEKDVADLAANWQNMQKFLNHFEELLKVEGRTVIEKIDDNLYSVVIPLFWVQTTYLVSLHGLFLRVAIRWDGTGDPMKFAKGEHGMDTGYVRAALTKIDRLIKDGCPAEDWERGCTWHNEGITTWTYKKPKGLIGAPFVKDTNP